MILIGTNERCLRVKRVVRRMHTNKDGSNDAKGIKARFVFVLLWLVILVGWTVGLCVCVCVCVFVCKRKHEQSVAFVSGTSELQPRNHDADQSQPVETRTTRETIKQPQGSRNHRQRTTRGLARPESTATQSRHATNSQTKRQKRPTFLRNTTESRTSTDFITQIRQSQTAQQRPIDNNDRIAYFHLYTSPCFI